MKRRARRHLPDLLLLLLLAAIIHRPRVCVVLENERYLTRHGKMAHPDNRFDRLSLPDAAHLSLPAHEIWLWLDLTGLGSH